MNHNFNEAIQTLEQIKGIYTKSNNQGGIKQTQGFIQQLRIEKEMFENNSQQKQFSTTRVIGKNRPNPSSNSSWAVPNPIQPVSNGTAFVGQRRIRQHGPQVPNEAQVPSTGRPVGFNFPQEQPNVPGQPNAPGQATIEVGGSRRKKRSTKRKTHKRKTHSTQRITHKRKKRSMKYTRRRH